MHSLNKNCFISCYFMWCIVIQKVKQRSWPQGSDFMWSCVTMCHLTQTTLMGHVTGKKKSKLKQKKDKSNLNSYLNYKSPFCPFWIFQNPFGIWGCDKKQSWSLSYEDQLWYTKFLKFTYKVWSNFEMIQIFKCTPNLNFEMEAEFENVS